MFVTFTSSTFTCCFIFRSGFPFLWKSVEIYRFSLPFTEISELESNPSLSFPCRFQAIFFNFNSNFNPNRLQLSILNHITKLTSNHSQCGSCTNNPALSVTVNSSSHCVQTNFTDNLYRRGTITVLISIRMMKMLMSFWSRL